MSESGKTSTNEPRPWNIYDLVVGEGKMARRAMYDAHDWSISDRTKFEAQLRKYLPRLRTLYEVEESFTDSQARTEILRQYFQSLDDVSIDNALVRNSKAFSVNVNRFNRIFGVPLRDYWPNNALGFDILRFDTEVIKSGDRAMRECVTEKFGSEGLQVILSLLGTQP